MLALTVLMLLPSVAMWTTTRGDEPRTEVDELAPSAAMSGGLTRVLDATTLMSGSFTGTDMLNRNASLDVLGVPGGVIGPALTFEAPSSWGWIDNFPASGSGNAPPGWTCSGSDYTYENGYMRLSGAQPPTHTWCQGGNSGTWMTNGDTTLRTEVWIMDNAADPDTDVRGVKIGAVVDNHPVFFHLYVDGNGEFIPNTSDGVSVVSYCTGQRTPLPSPSPSSADWHTWTVLADVGGDLALYQDGILRCRRSMWTTSHSANNHFDANVGGSSGDSSEAAYDWVAVGAGHHLTFGAGSWTSDTLSHDGRAWEQLDLDWWMGGVGTFADDVSQAVRISVLDASDDTPISGLENITPVENTTMTSSIDLGAVPDSTDVKIRVSWARGWYDWVGVHNLTLHSGAAILPDLAPSVVTFAGVNGDVPRAGLPISAMVALDVNGPSPPPGIITSTVAVDGALRAVRNDDLAAWPASNQWVAQIGGLTAGPHTVSVEMDVQGNLSEASETNNVRNATLKVSPNEAPQTNMTADLVGHPAGIPLEIVVADSVGGFPVETVHIDWGDTTNESVSVSGGPATITHAWNGVTSYQIRLWADLAGGYTSTVRTLNVTVANLPPTAVISTTVQTSRAGDFVSFSCADSIDTPGEPLTCEWSSSDGGGATDAVSFFHQFSSTGVYEITLTVSDPHGSEDTTTLLWLVSRGDVSGTVLELVPITNTTVPEGEHVDIHVHWNADLTPPNLTAVQMTWKVAGTAAAATQQGEWVWRIPLPQAGVNGPTEITLDTYWVAGATPLTDRDTLAIVIENRAPIAALELSTLTTVEDQEVVLNWSGSADDPWDRPGLNASLDVSGGGVVRIIDANHFGIRWSTSGDQHVTLTVTDEDGATDTLGGAVAVNNVAPSFTFRCFQDTVVRLTVECLVSDLDDTPSDLLTLSFDWDWDDGQASILSDVVQRHRYAEAGTYNISLIVTDDDGAEAVHVIEQLVELPEVTGEAEAEGLLGGVDNGLTLMLIAAGVGLLLVLGAVLVVTILLNGNKDDEDRAASALDQSSAFDDAASPAPAAPAFGGSSPQPAPGGLRNGPDGQFQQGPDGYWYRADGYGGFEQTAYVMQPDGLLYPYQ